VYLTRTCLPRPQGKTEGKVNLSAASLAKLHENSHVGHDRERFRKVSGIGACVSPPHIQARRNAKHWKCKASRLLLRWPFSRACISRVL
jgi:hypothetical protein